jgi:hypothetical protein
MYRAIMTVSSVSSAVVQADNPNLLWLSTGNGVATMDLGRPREFRVIIPGHDWMSVVRPEVEDTPDLFAGKVLANKYIAGEMEIPDFIQLVDEIKHTKFMKLEDPKLVPKYTTALDSVVFSSSDSQVVAIDTVSKKAMRDAVRDPISSAVIIEGLGIVFYHAGYYLEIIPLPDNPDSIWNDSVYLTKDELQESNGDESYKTTENTPKGAELTSLFGNFVAAHTFEDRVWVYQVCSPRDIVPVEEEFEMEEAHLGEIQEVDGEDEFSLGVSKLDKSAAAVDMSC